MKIKAIKMNLSKTEEIANQLRSNKEAVLKQVRDVEQLIDRSVAKIKVNIFVTLISRPLFFALHCRLLSSQMDRKIKSKEIDEIYADIMVKIDNQNNLLRSQLQVERKKKCFLEKNFHFVQFQEQRQAEEQERLRKIQEAIEIQRKIKEEEERIIRQEEENRKK